MNNSICDGYVELVEVKDIQIVLKYILKRFHEICVQNNLVYNIFGGTMLGAVRHNGFIPWDDDVDVVMPFRDYDRLAEIIKDDNELVLKKTGDKGYAYPFFKLCLRKTILIENISEKYATIGAYVDIFPVGGYPQSNESRFFNRLFSLSKKRGRAIRKLSPSKVWWKKFFFPIRIIQALPFKIIGAARFEKKEEALLRSCPFNSNEYLLLHGAGWGKKGKLKKTVFFERTLYRFEDITVFGIKDYDEHLRNLYGNYMELPPVEKRVSNHNYHLYIDKKLLMAIRGDNRNDEV